MLLYPVGLCNAESGKMEQEQRSLMLTSDFFKKIIITKDTPVPYYNEDGNVDPEYL